MTVEKKAGGFMASVFSVGLAIWREAMRVSDMTIPEEMKLAIVARSALIAEMQTHGAITTSVEYLQTPILLVMHQTDEQLRDSHARLMRTRRRGIRFDMNGRVFMLTRKAAIAVVREEIAARKKMANVQDHRPVEAEGRNGSGGSQSVPSVEVAK